MVLTLKLGWMIVGTLTVPEVKVGISMLDSDAEEVPIGLFSSVVTMEEAEVDEAGG